MYDLVYGNDILDTCFAKGCENSISLPMNPMAIAEFCEHRGWKEVCIYGYYRVFCPEHVNINKGTDE